MESKGTDGRGYQKPRYGQARVRMGKGTDDKGTDDKGKDGQGYKREIVRTGKYTEGQTYGWVWQGYGLERVRTANSIPEHS